MLDVGDNLERAYSTVPQQALKGLDEDGKPLTPEGAVKLLNGLVNGVKLTEKIFDQVSLAEAMLATIFVKHCPFCPRHLIVFSIGLFISF